MSLVDIERENRRRAILELLYEDADYACNEHILQAALSELGYNVSGSQLRTDVYFLGNLGLARADLAGGTLIVQLTHDGEDVAMGRVRADGVARKRAG